MKEFWRSLIASMLGTFMALFFMFIVSLAFIAGLSALSSSSWESELASIEDKSVLRIDLNGPLKDHIKRRDLLTTILNYDEPPVTGLFEISKVLKKAANDSRIKGVLLNFQNFQTGLANAEALRRELAEFKQSGKFMIAYGETYSELDYLVASVVDEVILYPKGYFEWDGLYTKISYLKNTMKKLDVVPQIFRVGKFKSAIEPLINEKMSEASREQVMALLEGAWKQFLFYAKEKTQLSEDELNTYADEASVMFADDAHEKGFVNLLASFEEVEEKLKELTEQEEKPKYVGWRSYYKEVEKDYDIAADNVIAVVFAEGGIRTERGDDDGISSRELTKTLHEIRKDEKVKAVVVRVNSPGGSALASDVIWTATQWLKDAKPYVTSFGNVAASGGYYMSAGSQYIFAEPTTITGSIGVFGVTFATKEFWNKKIGMTFDSAKSHRFADMESLSRLLDPEESQKIQNMVETIYEDFLNVVTNGRTALETREQTHELAQGRVWIGTKAKELGLVDEMGGMDEAIAKAAEFAELSEYEVAVYPKDLSPFKEFMKQIGQTSVFAIKALVPERLRVFIETHKKEDLHEKIHMRLPFDLDIQ